MGRNDLALEHTNAVISSGKYELTATSGEAFNGATTSEDIFNIPVSVADGINNMQTFYAATAYGGRGDIEIQDEHLSLYEDGDARLSLFYSDPSTEDTRTGKWVSQFSNVKIIRLVEMYLIRAEANAQLGSSMGDSPLNDINFVRARADLAPLESVDLDAITHERRVELAHEGHRIHDVRRLKLSVFLDTEEFPYNDNRLLFPIPQREINVNRNLTQNSGYGQ